MKNCQEYRVCINQSELVFFELFLFIFILFKVTFYSFLTPPFFINCSGFFSDVKEQHGRMILCWHEHTKYIVQMLAAPKNKNYKRLNRRTRSNHTKWPPMSGHSTQHLSVYSGVLS